MKPARKPGARRRFAGSVIWTAVRLSAPVYVTLYAASLCVHYVDKIRPDPWPLRSAAEAGILLAAVNIIIPMFLRSIGYWKNGKRS